MEIADADWKTLRLIADTCNKCELHKNRIACSVLDDGDTQAPLMIVGEGPGIDESKQGVPFVGKTGTFLRERLALQGITKDWFYMTNVVKCHARDLSPTGTSKNRPPTTEEIKSCFGFLQRQVELVNPKLILCVGAPAANTVIKPGFKITKERGQVMNSIFGIPSIATVHPSYVMRQAPGYDYNQALSWLDKDITFVIKEVSQLLS